MFDIDAYLKDIAIKEVCPSDTLIGRTAEKCGEVLKAREKEKKRFQAIKRAALIFAPAAAMLLIGIFIGSRFFAAPDATAEAAAACFTVDINPSVCVNVDENSVVTGIVAQNDDAKDLIQKIDCVGLNAADAICAIVKQAKAEGFITEENRYVLVGCFGVNDNDATIGALQQRLEREFGDIVTLLVVSGTLHDKTEADSLNVSAGLLKLIRMAEGAETNNTEKVKDVADKILQKYSAPVLSVSEKPDGLLLEWTKIDTALIKLDGDIKISVAAGNTAADIQSGNAEILKKFPFDPNGSQTTQCKLTPKNSGIAAGTVKYYGIFVEYGSVTKIFSNVVRAKMPIEEKQEPKPAASSAASSEQTPIPTDEPVVSGSISGSAVVIKWRKESSDTLAGYKIVASKTNPNPKYPDDGYIKFITNKNTVSVKLYDGDGGLKGGQSYYFSVTYLYNDGSAIAANAVQLTVPKKTAETPPSDTDEPLEPDDTGDYPSTNISGSMEGTTAHLSWGRIDDSRLEGYKVVMSLSPNPSYPKDGYVYWITDRNQTSCSVDLSDKRGATVYFAITALYDSHNVKKTGNAVALAVPLPETSPEPASQSEESTTPETSP